MTARAEIVQALHVAQYIISFSSSAADDNLRFQRMFPDSAIARSFSQSYGIADFLKEELIYDVKCIHFTFMFDETTTQKIDKQMMVTSGICLQVMDKLQTFIEGHFS